MGYLDRVKALMREAGTESEAGPDGVKSVISAKSPTFFNMVDRREAVLGMPVEKAIELWRSEDAPAIHVPGGHIVDLEQFLSRPDQPPDYVESLRAWLEKVLKRRGEA